MFTGPNSNQNDYDIELNPLYTGKAKEITCDPSIYKMDHPALYYIKLYGKIHWYK